MSLALKCILGISAKQTSVYLPHVSSCDQRVASICSAWVTPHSNISASKETFFVVAVVGHGRHAIHATSADDRMTSFLSSHLLPSLRSAAAQSSARRSFVADQR